MTLDDAIVKCLTSYPGLSAVVGTKVFPVNVQQGAPLPVIRYQKTSMVPEYYMGGEAGCAESRYQISAFAATITQARDIAGKIRLALIPWIAAQAHIDQDLTIAAVFLENQFEMAETEEAEALSAYHVLSDYRFLHTDP